MFLFSCVFKQIFQARQWQFRSRWGKTGLDLPHNYSSLVLIGVSPSHMSQQPNGIWQLWMHQTQMQTAAGLATACPWPQGYARLWKAMHSQNLVTVAIHGNPQAPLRHEQMWAVHSSTLLGLSKQWVSQLAGTLRLLIKTIREKFESWHLLLLKEFLHDVLIHLKKIAKFPTEWPKIL